MKYKTKVDWWIHATFALMPIINAWIVIEFVLNQSVVSAVCAVIFLGLNALLIFPIWFNTHYILADDELLVKCGLGKGTRIPYAKITSVKETREPWSSAALSMDRIEIKFTVGVVCISPKNKQDFLQHLEQKINARRG